MTAYLADTSAWTNLHRSADAAERWEQLVVADQVRITDPVAIELLRTRQTMPDFRELRASLRLLQQAPIDHEISTRALEVFELLARHGEHRGVSVTDLLVAAAAERYGDALLHYDKDFDLIADVTGQPTEWIAPRGSL